MSNKENNSKKSLSLSMDLNAAGKFSEASIILENYLKKEPNDYIALVNLASNYRWLGKVEKSLKILEESIKINPDGAAAYNNMGNILGQLGKFNEAEEVYKKAMEIDDKIEFLNENLAGTLYKLGKFSESLLTYQSSKKDNSAEELQCLLALEKYDDFWEKIDELSIRPINIKVASISAYASEKLSIKDPYPFCKNPLDNIYVSKVNLFDQKILDLLKKVINISDNSNIDHSYQSLLNNGEQTAGNFFEHLDKGLDSLFYQFINKITLSYKNKFITSNDKIIKDWPKKSYLYGWFIKIKNQGFLDYHNHNDAWVSGSVYFQIPRNLNKNEAAIKFTCNYENYPKINNKELKEKIITLKTGDIVVFPSSLYHSTVPFNSDSRRICYAFDLKPLN
ncbi:MAG: hypothetical protein CMP62_05920 [Flavobacteriales bacterium]|nr:hypothetical protein [Flavobacteriales bacterium]